MLRCFHDETVRTGVTNSLFMFQFEDYDYGHTGDPALDREFERQYSGNASFIPDPIKKFLSYFRDMIKEGNGYEVANLYENTFPKLTEEYFKSSPWPEAEEVAPIVQEDQLFLILYKELYYRHIYARVQGGPTIEQRSFKTK